jgi:hypothetical protein
MFNRQPPRFNLGPLFCVGLGVAVFAVSDAGPVILLALIVSMRLELELVSTAFPPVTRPAVVKIRLSKVSVALLCTPEGTVVTQYISVLPNNEVSHCVGQQ